MFTLEEARRLADRHINAGHADAPWRIEIQEFDVGYVGWGVPPLGAPGGVGAGTTVVDRDTGEVSVWPSFPADSVIRMYREDRARRIPAPRTWDPAVAARRALSRAPYPATVTHLTLSDGRVITGESMKGDGEPHLHPLVRQALAAVPQEAWERGRDRCSQIAALSDALHRVDAQRAADGLPTVTAQQARNEIFAGADVVTHRIRESDDPLAGRPAQPCVSCFVVLDAFGFTLQSPEATR